LPTIRLHYNQLLLLLLLRLLRLVVMARLQMAAVGRLRLALRGCRGRRYEVAILATPAVRILPNR